MKVDTPRASPIVVLSPDAGEAHQIAGWLRGAGLGAIATARTCDEAIFLLGRDRPCLLIIDERVSARSEQRLLGHITMVNGADGPALVRLTDDHAPTVRAAVEVIRRPLTAHDLVFRVGTAMQRPDLLGRLDQSADQTAHHLAAARQMQIALLPTSDTLAALQETCGVGVSALCRSGEAVGGDFWGIWPTGKGRFALTIADFAGHGLSSALNTFRLHALLSDGLLPRGQPTRMAALLNERLYALLPRGQYATMVYMHIDPGSHRVAWSSAGGPPPLFVSPDGSADLMARGLPLGVKAGGLYKRQWMRFPGPGILAVFSDGLFESGGQDPDVPRAAISAALVEPARIAARGELATAAQEGTMRLEALRDLYPCPNHSDDVMAICVAFGWLPN